jgi:Heterokaryon incompatibility protein (HET)
MPTMYLLNTSTLKLERFPGESTKPKYAILSHRWGRSDEEASFQDLGNGNYMHKRGWKKIASACGAARAQGHGYLWADTCCINKVPENNPEQTDALNSMFEWYGAAEVCYAYLEDVEDVNDEDLLRKSQWFERGWTLQELLAPQELIFCSRDWNISVDRFDIPGVISSITGILGGYSSFYATDDDQYTLDDVMSWAARRKTTKPEDAAYSLIGLLKLRGSLKISYGEGGARALVRLQEKLMEGGTHADDLTIFDWTSDADESVPHRSMFATSPKAFVENERSIFIRIRSDIFKKCKTLLEIRDDDSGGEESDEEDESDEREYDSVRVAENGLYMFMWLMELKLPCEQVGNAVYELDLGSAVITDECGVKKTGNVRIFVSEKNGTYYEAFNLIPSFRRRAGLRFFIAFMADFMETEDGIVGILLVSGENEQEKHRVIMNRRIGITRGSSSGHVIFSNLERTDFVVA